MKTLKLWRRTDRITIKQYVKAKFDLLNAYDKTQTPATPTDITNLLGTPNADNGHQS